jgi:His/Glu/Gln/Arg/opine family amino acid ABC transporter permease subunit
MLNRLIGILGLNNLIDAFILNFIEGNRYVLILNGLGVTLQVTFFAIIIGSIIGFILAMANLSNSKIFGVNIFKLLASAYVDIIRGTPAVVQLLIMYFVIFGSVNISRVVVAIIAFGINSGAYIAEIIRAGILAVDKGQMEAGRSLGLSYPSTMRYIIIPQAIKNILPALVNELIVLIKETAIVGYIALVDLTKAGDIIRSRTYSAYMPLLTVAFIYLCLTKALSKLLSRLERRLRQGDSR